MLTSEMVSKRFMAERLPPSPPVVEVETAQNGAIDVNRLLDPVRPGLRQVEEKMRAVDSALFAPLANAFINLIGSGGKRLRPALALLAAEFNGSLQSSPEYARIVALAASVEMLHTATLVHDDVIDGAMLRRGAPTLNATWSGGSTVLAGNYMFGTAARFSAETRNMRVINTFSATLHTIVNGELRQWTIVLIFTSGKTTTTSASMPRRRVYFAPRPKVRLCSPTCLKSEFGICMSSVTTWGWRFRSSTISLILRVMIIHWGSQPAVICGRAR
ncbi:MAG: polyprenyl synthetase family protein [Anaerolineales bacterium]|nr:polyprenyl synthetase family protein [Anaerolineales bacterium]